METTVERRCRTHGRFSSLACPTCGLPPVVAPEPAAETTPARNGRSLTDGAFVFYATKAMPSAGVLVGDRIVMRQSGRAMLTRLLPTDWLARASAESGAPMPVRPPCTAEGCSLGDCDLCDYINHLEAQLAAAGQQP